MDHFYDGQMRRYLTQFIRVMSNFSYKDTKGNLTQVPVRYGDMSRQVASIISQNSENIIQSAPFISCYIKDIQYDRDRLQDPTYVSKVHIRERATTADGTEYLNTQGSNYTVERLMPAPFLVTFNADIWTTNTDQKLQLWEQMAVLFNPSLEIQTTDNFLDWTSLSLLELVTMQFESRSLPQGLESEISICSLSFKSPVWITPPAKVKKLGIITKIINNIFEVPTGTADSYSDYGLADLFAGEVVRDKVVVTPGNHDIVVLNNIATLLPVKYANDNIASQSINGPGGKVNWKSVLDLYPGQFTAGLSQLRLTRPDGGEIVAYVSLNPVDDFSLMLNVDGDTTPTNTIIAGSGYVTAIINPQTFNPGTIVLGTRYLILEDTVVDTEAWGSFDAKANDIIEFNGSTWSVIFESATITDLTYITNAYTGVQYKWDGEVWSKSYEGVYDSGAWRLVL
jgi:hypothetical protein